MGEYEEVAEGVKVIQEVAGEDCSRMSGKLVCSKIVRRECGIRGM